MKNNDSVRALAKAMEESAKANDAAVRRARLIAGAALVVAGVSLFIAIGT